MSARPFGVWSLCHAAVLVLLNVVTTAVGVGQQVAGNPQSAETRDGASVLDRPVSVHVEKVSLRDAIDAIAGNAKIHVQYKSEIAPRNMPPVSLNVSGVSVRAAFAQLLSGTSLVAVPLSETSVGLVLSRTAPLETTTQGGGTLTGAVTDSVSGVGLVGVKLSVKGTQISSVTNDSGQYVLRNLPARPQTIVARHVGYTAAQKLVTVREGADTVVSFRLRRVTTVLSEVVTTAAGDRQRLEVGNSVARLNVDSLRQIAPITSTVDLLDGHVPGLVVTRGSGAPGAPARIRIRGIGSISASNDPIIIVNGVRVYSNQTTNERDAQFSVLDRIDPSTIRTIEVLRGPSASALYGSDASAGVIVVTTRRGESGQTHWTFSTDQYRTTQPQNFPTLYYREGIQTIGNTLAHCPLGNISCKGTKLTAFNPLADRRTTVLGTGYRQNYSASVSGGSSTLLYALSGNTDADLGVLKMSDADAAYLESTTGLSIPKWQRRPQSGSSAGGSARFTLQPVPALTFDLSTTLNRSARSTTPLDGALNVYQSSATPKDTSLVTASIADFRRRTTYRDLALLNSVAAKWIPVPFFSLMGDAGVQNISQQTDMLLRRDDCVSPTCGDFVTGQVSSLNGRRSVGTVNLKATTQLPSRLGMQVTPVIGVNYIRETINDVTIDGNDLPPGGASTNGAKNVQTRENGTTPVQLGLYLSTGVWLFDERLHTEFGTRIDASNALGKQVRPSYPKLDLSYPISRESFFPSNLGSLRLRLAYGHSAVQPDVGATQRTYLTGFGVDNGILIPVQHLATLGNTRLRPERSTELEGGFDLGLFNERMHVNFTGVRKLSRDALVKANSALSVGGIGDVSRPGGVTTFTSNIGSVRNTGLELSADAIVIDRAVLRWSVNGYISRNRNTLLKLASEADRGLLGAITPGGNSSELTYGTRYVEGYPLAGTWVRPAVRYADSNGDGVITKSEITFADSAVFVGGPLPNYDAAFGTQVGLWNGRVSIATQFQYQNGMSQANETVLNNLFGVRSAETLRALNDPSVSMAEQARYRSGYAALHALSTLRLQSLSVRVIAPQRLTRWLRASAGSIALQGDNIGLWTNYSGADPNVTGSIVGNTVTDPGVLPMPRTWGVNVSLNY